MYLADDMSEQELLDTAAEVREQARIRRIQAAQVWQFVRTLPGGITEWEPAS